MTPEPSTLTLRPIGFMRTGMHVKFQTRHQPQESEGQTCVLELISGCGYEQGLQDLAGFSRIWLLWWFHRNENWRPLVLPPRGNAQRRGVFATRSPHRPNPLGLTPVTLHAIKGNRLLLGDCDLVDGTPVFDIKPYYPPYDAFPAERGGWIETMEHELAEAPRYQLQWSELAQQQLDWLAHAWQIDFRARLQEVLERDPSLHRTRRIRRLKSGATVIGCGAWRVHFTVADQLVCILFAEPAYPPWQLTLPAYTHAPDREAQLAFEQQWGSSWSQSDTSDSESI